MSHPLHASAFAYHGMGCMLLGAAGAGKSSFIAQAILHGATLIADDHVLLHADGKELIASAPLELRGVLELRGLGIITMSAHNVASHRLHLAIKLVAEEVERFPSPKTIEFLGISLPVLLLPAAPFTPVASALLYLLAMQEGRILPQDWRPEPGVCSKPLQSSADGVKSGA